MSNLGNGIWDEGRQAHLDAMAHGTWAGGFLCSFFYKASAAATPPVLVAESAADETLREA